MDSCAVSSVDDARKPSPGAVRRGEPDRRRARLRGMSDRPSRLASDRRGPSSPRHAWRRPWRISSSSSSRCGRMQCRPRFVCRVAHHASHAPFRGFNRAQAAVIEGAVLVSRLHMLPRAEVEAELARLEIIVGKTAGSGGGRSLELAQGESGASLRRRRNGGWTCGSFRSLTSWAAKSCARGWAIARPIGRSKRRSRRAATPSTSCADFLPCIRFRRFTPPISTRSRATATMSPRYAGSAPSSRHCGYGSTTARRTPTRSTRSFEPISERPLSAANRSVTSR